MSEETIEVKTKVSFRTFDIPESALLDLGDGKVSPILLNELEDDVVDALVRRWLDAFYANRGERSPFQYSRCRDKAA